MMKLRGPVCWRRQFKQCRAGSEARDQAFALEDLRGRWFDWFWSRIRVRRLQIRGQLLVGGILRLAVTLACGALKPQLPGLGLQVLDLTAEGGDHVALTGIDDLGARSISLLALDIVRMCALPALQSCRLLSDPAGIIRFR